MRDAVGMGGKGRHNRCHTSRNAQWVEIWVWKCLNECSVIGETYLNKPNSEQTFDSSLCLGKMGYHGKAR